MPNFNSGQARGNASQTSRLGGENHLGGKVSLVGAGPGDPRLLTLRGFQCLQAADVVLYDGLANSEILGFAQSAVCESVGKHGESKIWTQQEINARILELARAGKHVVRLKGGDPAVFARSAEELEVLAEAEIPFEVEKTSLRVNDELIFSNGTPCSFDARALSQSMADAETVLVYLCVGPGQGSARFWTSDLTVDYVRFNSEYHT